jgi:hypothetical protein
MGSSSKMASAPNMPSPPANVQVPYGQTSPDNYSWTNFLPNPATGDPIRPAQLSDPTWQSSVPISKPPAAAAPGQDANALKALLAQMMMGQQPNPRDRQFGSSHGGGGLGGNYGTSGGGQSSHSYGRTSSGTRSSAHAGGGKWGGK